MLRHFFDFFCRFFGLFRRSFGSLRRSFGSLRRSSASLRRSFGSFRRSLGSLRHFFASLRRPFCRDRSMTDPGINVCGMVTNHSLQKNVFVLAYDFQKNIKTSHGTSLQIILVQNTYLIITRLIYFICRDRSVTDPEASILWNGFKPFPAKNVFVLANDKSKDVPCLYKKYIFHYSYNIFISPHHPR